MTQVAQDDILGEDFHRGYKITSRNPFGFWTVANEEGGAVPKKLAGTFTTLPKATEAIDSYLNAVEMEMKNKDYVQAQIDKHEKKTKEVEEVKAKEEAVKKVSNASK